MKYTDAAISRADAGPIVILLLVSVCVLVFIFSSAKKMAAKRKLKSKGFQIDHFWHFIYDYIALDLSADKIALCGGKPEEKAHGEGIYNIDKVIGAERWRHEESNQHISVLVAEGDNKLVEYVVQMKDPHAYQECMDQLRELGVQEPDDLDIAYV